MTDQQHEREEQQMSKDQAMAMLKYHSMIHIAKTMGAFGVASGAGIAFAVSAMAIWSLSSTLLYGIAAVVGTIGLLFSFVGPRLLTSALRGDVDA